MVVAVTRLPANLVRREKLVRVDALSLPSAVLEKLMDASDIGPKERAALAAYSRGEMSAIELRRRLDDATYGDVLLLLSLEDLPLPRASTEGREDDIARARALLFPRHDV